MKSSMKIFALLFAFTIISSTSLNAQFTDPNGDPGKPLLEIWVYGLNFTAISWEADDQIAAYDGDVCVGMLELTVDPDETNWVSSHLIAYTYDLSGNPLYTPGNPLQLRYYDDDEGDYYVASGAGIDFHDTWYAPIMEEPFYPALGAYGYCYVDLTFAAIPSPYGATLNVQVFEYDDNLPGWVELTDAQAAVSCCGVSLVWDGGADHRYEGNIFAGLSGTDDYNYTITTTATGFATESYVETFNPFTETVAVDIFLNTYDDLTGLVRINETPGGTLVNAVGAEVTTTINGVIYSAVTGSDGTYVLEDVPDGEWTFTYSYPGRVIFDDPHTIDHNSGNTTDNDVDLDFPQGTVSGEIFDAESIALITDDNIKVELWTLDGTTLVETFTSTVGTYSLETYGGIYDIVLTDISNANNTYETFTFHDYLIMPGADETLNFNMFNGTHSGYFDEITGNPNSMWTIQIEMAKFGGTYLLPFDEIAIYDTDQDKLVGSLVFEKTATGPNSGTNTLKAFAQFNTGATGFVEGNNMTFKAFDISHGEEYEVPINWWFHPDMGTYWGTTFPDPNENHISYLNIYWGTTPGQLNGHIGGDATSGCTATADLDGVTVSAINVFTGEVAGSYVTGTGATGDYSIQLDPGTYQVRMSKDGYETFETIEPHVLILQSDIVTLNKTLVCQSEVEISYSLSEPGYHFISRCVEVASTDMRPLLNNNASPVDWDGTNMHSSWVANDTDPLIAGTTQLYWDLGAGPAAWDPDPYAWILLEGYQVFIEDIASDFTFDMEGYLEKPETNPIALTTGISYIPYFTYDYSASPQDDALTAFDGILGELDWVMDSYGNRLHNDNGVWYDNVGPMKPGAGYKIKMNTAATLTYPASAKKSATNGRVLLDPVHFVYNQGNAGEWTYTMYINTNDFEIGDELAAYSNDVLVGSMVIDSEEPWENDLNTFNQAINGGYDINTPIELVAWDASEGAQYSVIFEMENVNGSCYLGEVYPPGLAHFSYVNLYRGVVSVDENQVDNAVRVYPNPANTTLNIESVSNINQITVYNIHGALISATNVNAKTQQVDVSNFVTGTYLIQLHTDTGVITKRVIVK
ncbi:MAG: carboxypeptidase regulatory-like domain-containing protein [Bacteroidota bacterium]